MRMDSFDRPPPVGVFPDFGAINSPGLSAVVGALMTITLLLAVLVLIVGGLGGVVGCRQCACCGPLQGRRIRRARRGGSGRGSTSNRRNLSR